MQRLILPLLAALLLALAVTGIVLGLRSNADTPPPDPTAAKTQTSPTSPTAQGPAAPITPPADPASLIRYGTPTPPAKPDATIRLATYNAENLFDAIDDPALSDRNEDIDDAKPQPELQALADTIIALDADILALQEIESEAVITWFRDTYLQTAGYTHLASIDAGDERSIEQAILSRYPITGIANWPHRDLGGTHPDKWGNAENYNAGQPIQFHRSPLRATIEIPAAPGAGASPYRLTLYVIHAKSGGPGEYWREAEANGLVQILQSDTAPGANIAILGDFNAALTAPSLQTITAAGFTDALAPVLTPGPRFVTHESGRRIDYILINPDLAQDLAPNTGFVLGTPALPEGLDWRDPYRPDGYASDHYPVAVDLIPRD